MPGFCVLLAAPQQVRSCHYTIYGRLRTAARPGAIDHGLQVLVGFTGSVRVSNALSSAGGLDRAESGHAWDWPDRTLAGCWCTATRATGPARPLGLQSGAWQVLEVADAPQFHEWKL